MGYGTLGNGTLRRSKRPTTNLTSQGLTGRNRLLAAPTSGEQWTQTRSIIILDSVQKESRKSVVPNPNDCANEKMENPRIYQRSWTTAFFSGNNTQNSFINLILPI